MNNLQGLTRTPRTLLLTSAAPQFYPDEAPPAAAPASDAASRLYPDTPATPAPEAPATPSAPDAPAGEAPKPEVETPTPEGETKPEGEAKPEDKKPEEPAAPKTPEEIAAAAAALDLKLPEGFEVKTEALDSFKTLAAEAGLTNESAQKLVDLYAKELSDLAGAQTQAWNDTLTGWKNELEALPDFKTQAQRDANQIIIGRALDEYGSPEAREAFNITGAGWNPHIVQMFYKMAVALGEGAPTPPGGPAAQPKSRSERLYGNQS